jgi:hypothetical protein
LSLPACLVLAELAGARQKDREVTEVTFHTWMNVSASQLLPHLHRYSPAWHNVGGMFSNAKVAKSDLCCRSPPLQLARLMALSHGEAALTRERWAAMQALESRRQQRLAKPA